MNLSILRKPEYKSIWRRLKVGVYAGALALLVYGGIMFIAPGVFTYSLTLPAVGIITITAIARLNATSTDLVGTSWNLRRAGLVLTALFALGVGAWPLLYGTGTPWVVVIGVWGFALTWLTTPGQPPWYKFVFGDYRE